MKHLRFILFILIGALVLTCISQVTYAQVSGSFDIVVLAERYLPFLVVAIACALAYHVIKCDQHSSDNVADRRRLHKRINRIDKLTWLMCGKMGIEIPKELHEVDDEDD